MCQHGNRRILRVNPHGDTTVLADSFEGRRLNSPNDVVARTDGSIWFTDPPFGRPAMADDPDRELHFSGVFRVSPDGDDRADRRLARGTQRNRVLARRAHAVCGKLGSESKVVVRYELSADGDVLDRDRSCST